MVDAPGGNFIGNQSGLQVNPTRLLDALSSPAMQLSASALMSSEQKRAVQLVSNSWLARLAVLANG